ncbi:MAG: membrane protein insertion efficiency factor YidD [Chlamydiales bacterium]|nr:membrane protein insertion efficiency factor YidD [Chlamydiales bacterium]
MKFILILLVRGYQLVIGPYIGKSCRFYPSCSDYAIEALKKHGGIKGTWLTIKRLGRCNPWHSGGVDEVPD